MFEMACKFHEERSCPDEVLILLKRRSSKNLVMKSNMNGSITDRIMRARAPRKNVDDMKTVLALIRSCWISHAISTENIAIDIPSNMYAVLDVDNASSMICDNKTK